MNRKVTIIAAVVVFLLAAIVGVFVIVSNNAAAQRALEEKNNAYIAEILEINSTLSYENEPSENEKTLKEAGLLISRIKLEEGEIFLETIKEAESIQPDFVDLIEKETTAVLENDTDKLMDPLKRQDLKRIVEKYNEILGVELSVGPRIESRGNLYRSIGSIPDIKGASLRLQSIYGEIEDLRVEANAGEMLPEDLDYFNSLLDEKIVELDLTLEETLKAEEAEEAERARIAEEQRLAEEKAKKEEDDRKAKENKPANSSNSTPSATKPSSGGSKSETNNTKEEPTTPPTSGGRTNAQCAPATLAIPAGDHSNSTKWSGGKFDGHPIFVWILNGQRTGAAYSALTGEFIGFDEWLGANITC